MNTPRSLTEITMSVEDVELPDGQMPKFAHVVIGIGHTAFIAYEPLYEGEFDHVTDEQFSDIVSNAEGVLARIVAYLLEDMTVECARHHSGFITLENNYDLCCVQHHGDGFATFTVPKDRRDWWIARIELTLKLMSEPDPTIRNAEVVKPYVRKPEPETNPVTTLTEES